MTDLTAFYIFLGILAILAIVGIVFASHVSILWAATVFFGIALVIITLWSFFSEKLRDKIEKAIEKVDFIGMLRRMLVQKINFSISEKIQRIVILIMSAASAALIVRAIVIVVTAVTEYSKTESWDNMDWLIDLMGDVPVMNVFTLIMQASKTEFRPDFFVTVLLLSLIVMAIAAAVVQMIMALVNKLIEEAKDESKLFGFLGGFSVVTLTVAGTMFVSSLISPLLDFSKPWDWFEKLCKPIFTTSFGNFLLQVLVAAIMFAILVVLCFDWVKDIVQGATGIVALLLFQLLYTFIFGLFIHDLNNGVVWEVYLPLLCVLYPIVDIIKNYLLKMNRISKSSLLKNNRIIKLLFPKENSNPIWLPAVVPLVLSMIIVLVATVIGKINALGDFLSNPMITIISVLVFVVYLLAKSGISIIKQDRDDTGSAAVSEVCQSES